MSKPKGLGEFRVQITDPNEDDADYYYPGVVDVSIGWGSYGPVLVRGRVSEERLQEFVIESVRAVLVTLERRVPRDELPDQSDEQQADERPQAPAGTAAPTFSGHIPAPAP
jgi:hypothetical protein